MKRNVVVFASLAVSYFLFFFYIQTHYERHDPLHATNSSNLHFAFERSDSNRQIRKFQVADEGSVQTRKPREIVIYSATKFFRMDVTTTRFLSECHSVKGQCRISEDLKDYPSADAVLFHNADFMGQNVHLLPRKRSQPYVLWSLESPTHDKFRPPAHVINWTMTPRRDSDIWYPYGHMVKRTQKVDVDFEDLWRSKTADSISSWLASNCFASNGRTTIINQLIKFGVTTDKWGACGQPPPQCDGISKQGWDCVIDLIRPYKFYMAFENSNCKDYVTEKFYETARVRMAVPLVIRRSTYEDVGIPGDSFIALDDFKSTKEMAEFVVEVANNKTAYLMYHKWRESYEIFPEHHDSTGFCELCRRLQNRAQGLDDVSFSSYADLQTWQSEGICEPSYAQSFLVRKDAKAGRDSFSNSL